MGSGLLDRHIAFVEALRSAGLPVSLAEDLDAVRALGHLSLVDRESLRASYAATLVKRSTRRAAFDTVFDLFFPALLGEGVVRGREHHPDDETGASDLGLSDLTDGPDDLTGFRERLAEALGDGDRGAVERLAREGAGALGPMRAPAPWSSSSRSPATLDRGRGKNLQR